MRCNFGVNSSEQYAVKSYGQELVRVKKVEVTLLSMHSQGRQESFERSFVNRLIFLSEGCARHSDMVEETARGAVRGMHWANESPSFRQQLSNCGGLHLSEVLASMDGPEVTQVPRVVQLVSNNRESSCLLHVKLTASDKVASRQKVFHFLTN